MEDSSFDPQGTQWYAVDPNGSTAGPPTSPDRKKKKMRLLIGGGAILIVLLLGGLLARSFFGDRAAQEALRQEKTSAAKEACDEARNPEKCREAAPLDLAREEGDPVFCESVTEDASRDACLALAAASAGDEAVCEEISDAEKRDDCHDAVVAERMKKEGETAEGCAEYRDQEKQQSCLGNVLWAQAFTGDCSDERISEARCEEARITNEAIAARDPNRCQAIEDESREDACRDRVGPGDVDGDGLNADDERDAGTNDQSTDSDGDGLLDGEEVAVHNTDPAKTDTDGDGYPDGTEVSGGYDPLH